jgi:hypothetical protein
VKDFLSKWRDNKLLKGEESFSQITGALKDLGQFYQKNGQRARLKKDVAERVLGQLAAAESLLPPEEKNKLLPFL